MANCNKLFLDFIKQITPTAEQMQKMKKSRQALESKISDVLQEKLGMTVSYYTQGSGAKDMKTMIVKSNGTYDADRGVYLPQEPEVNAETVQKYVYDAVKDHTEDGAEHRKKCVRVLYKCEYNIDFPVYYEVEGESYSYLAIKGNGWIKDDPSKMVEWFAENKDEQGQLIRIVKDVKAWASERGHKMPSGIALTVWTVRNFVAVKDRDDKALAHTLRAIYNSNYFIVSCPAPVEPYDDLVDKLNSDQKENFRNALKEFLDAAELAVEELNQLKASKIWRKYLGERFPLGVDENVDQRANALIAAAAPVLNGNAKLNPTGIINETNGVNHKSHRNFGA
jgi:hypothetical protein